MRKDVSKRNFRDRYSSYACDLFSSKVKGGELQVLGSPVPLNLSSQKDKAILSVHLKISYTQALQQSPPKQLMVYHMSAVARALKEVLREHQAGVILSL